MNEFLLNRELKWGQPSAFRQEFELRSGSEVLATLRFRSMFGTMATAESGGGCWTFKRVGFWQTRATVRACDSETDIGVFRNDTWSGGGTLELPDGRNFRATTNFWQDRLEVLSDKDIDELLLVFKSEGLVHLSASVEVKPDASELAELPWLLAFGWYLIVMMHNDGAATTAAVATG